MEFKEWYCGSKLQINEVLKASFCTLDKDMISELKLAVNRSGEVPLSIPIYRKWWNHEIRRQKQQRENTSSLLYIITFGP